MRPLPEPEWVFASLATRWQALADGAPLPDGLANAVAGHLELADFQLTMAEHLVKAGQPARRGSVGQLTYRVVEPQLVPAPVLAGLDALITYASYAGIGDRTAVGMGYVHLVPAPDATGATADDAASPSLVDPAGYARRVQARPYGPHQIDAGPVQATFHGPYAVLAFTDADGAAITIRASVDDPPVGADLAAVLTAAADGHPAILEHPDRLVCQHSLATNARGTPRPRVQHLTAVPGPAGPTVFLIIDGQHHTVTLNTDQAKHLATEVTAWASAR
jgi:hypothetical protein